MEKNFLNKTFFTAFQSVVFFVIMSFSPVFAGEAILSWNENSEPDLSGYKVYFGVLPGVYGTPIDVGNQTTYTLTGLGGGTYYFSVTAYDTSGNEGGFAAEASKTFATSDTTPPVLSNITVENITGTGATISWVTDEPATSQVEYGTTTSYGSATALDPNLITNPSHEITGLQAGTTYHFRVRSIDSSGNIGLSGDSTFTTTSQADTTPPVISSVLASNISASGAVITWTTDEPSTGLVEFGVTGSYGQATPESPNPSTTHSHTLSGLNTSTTYHFRVKSTDGAGNPSFSGDRVFSTTTQGDSTPPQISEITVSNLSETGATISWTTNEASTSQVEFGTSAMYGSQTPLSSTLVASHSQSLSGLLSETVYYFRVRSTDGSGNLSISLGQIFVTSSGPDNNPPEDVIGFSAIGGDGQVTLSWTNPSDPDFVGVRILYRTDRFPADFEDGFHLGDIPGDPGQAQSLVHSPVENNVTYYYSAASYDLNGNFQTTAFATAIPGAGSTNTDGDSSISGGCGMVFPTNGNGGGPGQSADMLGMLIIPILILSRRRLIETLRALLFPKPGILTHAPNLSILNPKGIKSDFIGNTPRSHSAQLNTLFFLVFLPFFLSLKGGLDLLFKRMRTFLEKPNHLQGDHLTASARLVSA